MAFLLFYTDPGSGMMLLQLLFASLVGAFYYFRNFFFRIFGRKSSSQVSDAGNDSTETDETSDAAR